MKTVTLLFAGLFALFTCNLFASDAPRGNLLELHSCELFAGGCVVSSQATLDGRYMLQAWDFTGGSFAGVDRAGLQMALLQSATQNLAAETASPDQAVVYLPEKASSSQRKALLAWLKTSQPKFNTFHFKSKVASLRFAKDGAACSFRAGDGIRVNTASLESCEKGGCGEA